MVSLLSVSPLCLVLSWSGPCYDGGSAVLGYVVEVRRKGPAESGGWSELTAHCKSTSYKVRAGLEPQGEYCFRVRAYNVVGVSEPSEESQLIKMEQIGEPCWCLVDWFQQESYTVNFMCVAVYRVAQLVEHGACNARVVVLIPTGDQYRKKYPLTTVSRSG